MNQVGVRSLSVYDRIGIGAFADVFAPAPGDRAYKLFKRLSDPSLTAVTPHVFRAEVAAYEIVAAHPALRPHAPVYHGILTLESVEGVDHADISGAYWLDLCYCIERLRSDPHERKLGSFFGTRAWSRLQRIEAAFEAAGIIHLGDASVFYWHSDQPMLIDFAVSDAAADYAQIDSEPST